ncbi:MAG: hypothetical protein EXS13_00370 [Planctomycetes bacterium]|nr:hypothetical protein [Planctomycetota bacterium]
MKSRSFFAAFALVIAAPSLRADTLHLKDGAKLEGKVVAEDKTGVTIETPLGRMVIERARIARIEKGPTAREDLEQREKALAADASAEKWFELAEFAASKGLKRERERLLDATLKRDRNHAGANLASGRVQHDGRWLTPAERDLLVKAAEVEAMRARGLVEWEGRFVTPEEKAHFERGDVRVDVRGESKWMTADEAKRAQGLERIGNDWFAATEVMARRRAQGFAKEARLNLTVLAGEHLVCATAFGKGHAKQMLEASEKGYLLAAEVLKETASDLTWIGGHKALAIVVDTRDDFGGFARFFARDESKVDQRWAEGVAKVDGFFWWDPTGSSATYKGGRHVDDTTAHTVHHLGHVFLNRHGYNFRFLPSWLDEGFAAWFEYRVLGRNAISCIAARRYASQKTVRKEELLANARWFEDAVKLIRDGKDPMFPSLLPRDLSTIEPEEVSKAMVVIDWLVTERKDGFLKLLATLREQWPKGIVPPTSPAAAAAHRAAFAALGLPAELLDAELRRAIAERPVPKRGDGQRGEGK